MAISALARHKVGFTHWQVWAVLLLAGSCAFFSVGVHNLGRDQGRIAHVIATLEGLAESPAPAPSFQWLIRVQRVLPAVRLFAGPSTLEFAHSLEDLTEHAQRNELRRADYVLFKQRLEWMASELRGKLARQVVLESRYTHFYYWSVIGFVLAIVALFRRGRLRQDSPIGQMLTDNVLFPNAPIAMALADAEDRLIRVNPAFEQLTGFTEEELYGRSAQSRDSLRHDLSFVDDMRAALDTTGRWSGDYWMRRKDGSAFAEKVMRVALRGESGPEGYLTLSMDPVMSDEEQRFMLWQAHHDNLTKLPNGNLLHERLARALVANQQQQAGKRGAVISIDLDNFQMVNDSVGYASGDQVLMDVAYRIAMCARETDTVARMGSDLFVLVLNEIDDLAEPERIARAAVDEVSKPFHADEREFFITASVGIAIFPDDGREKGQLLQRADAARMNAKANGGNRVAFYEDEMTDAAARRMEIETQLRKAVAEEQLELHYQPIMDVAHGEVYGAEALLRWQHPHLGMVSPAEFVPIAEETGLIVEIGHWVIEEVQRQLAAWRAAGLPELRVSINVSARQIMLEPDARDVLAALGRDSRRQITVELTESALIEDLPGPKCFLAGLKELDINIALDDFGTGYSSVGYLRNFEFDVLKIDKSFIDELEEVRDYGLVASIVSMGRILGMRVVAEGVEEEGQLTRLKQIGCDYVQGYFYSKPLPVADFERFVSQQKTQSVG